LERSFPAPASPQLVFNQSGALSIFGFRLKFADRDFYQGFRTCPKAQE
jgi:hypothetical protein